MMSDIDIEDFILEYLKDSTLSTSINGVMRAGRPLPPNSEKEDVRIKVLANSFAQIQMAYVNVNVYVPNIYNETEKQYELNKPRLRILSQICKDLLNYVSFGNIHFEIEKQTVSEAKGVNKHFINNRLLFKQVNR